MHRELCMSHKLTIHVSRIQPIRPQPMSDDLGQSRDLRPPLQHAATGLKGRPKSPRGLRGANYGMKKSRPQFSTPEIPPVEVGSGTRRSLHADPRKTMTRTESVPAHIALTVSGGGKGVKKTHRHITNSIRDKFNVAKLQRERGNTMKAHQFYKELVRLVEQHPESIHKEGEEFIRYKFEAHWHYSQMSLTHGYYEVAESQALKAVDCIQNLEDKSGTHEAYLCLGHAYMKLNHFDMALDAFKRSRDLGLSKRQLMKLEELVEKRKKVAQRAGELTFKWNDQFQAIVDEKTEVATNEGLRDLIRKYAPMDSGDHSSDASPEQLFRKILELKQSKVGRFFLMLKDKHGDKGIQPFVEAVEQESRKKLRIYNLLKAFQEKAKEAAITVVRELGLPYEEKSIKPRVLLQTDGGATYYTDGIALKLPSSLEKLGGTISSAPIKAFGNELKGLKAYFESETDGLYVPLEVAVDYCGFRILAISWPDINNVETLVYGSNNDGDAFITTSPTANALMESAAKKLNLAGHMAGRRGMTAKHIFTGGEVEGHLGNDNKFYVLETSMLFPAQAHFGTALLIPQNPDLPLREVPFDLLEPEMTLRRHLGALDDEDEHEYKRITDWVGTFYFNTSKRGDQRAGVSSSANHRAGLLTASKKQTLYGDVLAVRTNDVVRMWKRLRPELVRRYGKALSSDAYSFLQKHDENEDELNDDVTEAFYYLRSTVISKLLSDLAAHKVDFFNIRSALEELHRRGINFRLLGEVRSKISNKTVRQSILAEMCARVMKNVLRERMRRLVAGKEWIEFDDVAMKTMVLQQFNVFLGNSEKSAWFWKVTLKTRLQFFFPNSLSEEEADVCYDLRENLMKFPFFKTLQEKTGVQFKIGAQKRLFEHPFLFDTELPLSLGDIEDFRAQTKNIYVKEEDLTPLLRMAIEGREVETLYLTKMISDVEVTLAYNTMIERRYQHQLTDILGSDSTVVIKSYYTLASLYRQMGNMEKALDYASRGLSAGEVVYGSFAEETVMGLVSVGEIMHHRKKKEEAIEYYRRALSSVEKLYTIHPLLAKLNLALAFLYQGENSVLAKAHLQESFRECTALYGMKLSKLIVPLLAMKNNMEDVTVEIDKTVASFHKESTLEVADRYWPRDLLFSVSNALNEERPVMTSVLTSLGLPGYIEPFKKFEVYDNDFLQLDEAKLRKFGVTKVGHRKKILIAIMEHIASGET